MKCIYCDSTKSMVTETVAVEAKVLRKRKCKQCGKYFFTEEKGSVNNQIFYKYELTKTRQERRKAAK